MHRRTYPYWIVTWRTGRLPTPIQFRGTPIARMFESGKVGGARLNEQTFTDEYDALAFAHRQRMAGPDTVDVYIVPAPNRCRELVRDWRSRSLRKPKDADEPVGE